MRLQTKQARLEYQNFSIESIKKRHPLGFTVEHMHDLVIVSYVSDVHGTKRPCVQIFKANAAHPFANHYFRSFEARQNFTDQQIASAAARCKTKSERQEKRRNFRHALKVGDILYDSWGYDQTNIDYFQVVDAEEFFVTVRPIACKHVPGSDGFMSEQVQPAKDQFTGPEMRKKVCEGNCIRIRKWGSSAHLCSPESKHYHSWYA